MLDHREEAVYEHFNSMKRQYLLIALVVIVGCACINFVFFVFPISKVQMNLDLMMGSLLHISPRNFCKLAKRMSKNAKKIKKKGFLERTPSTSAPTLAVSNSAKKNLGKAERKYNGASRGHSTSQTLNSAINQLSKIRTTQENHEQHKVPKIDIEKLTGFRGRIAGDLLTYHEKDGLSDTFRSDRRRFGPVLTAYSNPERFMTPSFTHMSLGPQALVDMSHISARDNGSRNSRIKGILRNGRVSETSSPRTLRGIQDPSPRDLNDQSDRESESEFVGGEISHVKEIRLDSQHTASAEIERYRVSSSSPQFTSIHGDVSKKRIHNFTKPFPSTFVVNPVKQEIDRIIMKGYNKFGTFSPTTHPLQTTQRGPGLSPSPITLPVPTASLLRSSNLPDDLSRIEKKSSLSSEVEIPRLQIPVPPKRSSKSMVTNSFQSLYKGDQTSSFPSRVKSLRKSRQLSDVFSKSSNRSFSNHSSIMDLSRRRTNSHFGNFHSNTLSRQSTGIIIDEDLSHEELWHDARRLTWFERVFTCGTGWDSFNKGLSFFVSKWLFWIAIPMVILCILIGVMYFMLNPLRLHTTDLSEAIRLGICMKKLQQASVEFALAEVGQVSEISATQRRENLRSELIEAAEKLRETKNSLFEGEENGRTVAESSLDIRKLFFSSTCSRFESGCSSATSDTLYSENTIGILGSLLDKSYVTAITLSQYHSIYSVGGSEDIDIIADSYPYWFLNNVVPYDVIGGSSRVIALIYDHILDQQVSLWVIIVVSIVLVSLFLNFVLIYAALSVYPTIEEQRAIILLLWRHIPIKKIPSEHILLYQLLTKNAMERS
eukprot:gnl/Carplike_NY0171/4554_a6194_195.p1 GENE.gnl/Carplike_NY0171/4554_a6194_195~~gnl/Carplike_NY0171/4554_a6194_195.p1  ORF type:complete len:963 (+),score=127.82 gnl/Carplike_NY0171/4554_a6194_195:412-2889(+)